MPGGDWESHVIRMPGWWRVQGVVNQMTAGMLLGSLEVLMEDIVEDASAYLPAVAPTHYKAPWYLLGEGHHFDILCFAYALALFLSVILYITSRQPREHRAQT
jgi:hypothetical protein